MKSILSFLTFLTVAQLSAQLAPACPGGSPSTTCATACINCNFNGFIGSTAGYPSGIVPNFCGTVENEQWLGFIAGDVHATFTVTPHDCANGDGLQVALYEDCMGQPIACDKGQMDGGNIPVSLNVPLTPGHNFFLMIDGFAGDQCDFSVSVSPNSAVYEPPLGSVGSITGASKVCPGATMQYTVSEVFGASAYIWSGPAGAKIDTMPLPVTVNGSAGHSVWITFGDTPGSVCAQAANSCSQTPACSNAFQVDMLDDSYRPALTTDTIAHLTCSGAPATLDGKVQGSVGFAYSWTADSTGHIVSGQDFQKAQVDKIGTYTLLVSNNQNGCTSSVNIHVGEPDTPHTSDLRLRNITCYGFNDGILHVGEMESGLPPFIYSIDNQDFNTSPEFRYLTPGVHALTVVSADECRWDTTFTVTEPQEFLLNLGADTTLHLGAEISLLKDMSVNDPARVHDMRVEPASLDSMLCEDCMYEPLTSFRYTLTVIDSNGCMATDDRIVSVNKDRYVYAPNIFNPDAQQDENRVFTVFGGTDVQEVQWLRVFDRWGQLVFEHSAFNPGDITAGWDGRIRGNMADPGVFVWQAGVSFIDGATEKWTGNVTLVR